MNKESNIALILVKVNFVERYRNLRLAHQSENRFQNYDKEKVVVILKDFGYEAKFVRNGEFFKIFQKEGFCSFQLNICLKYGIVELILDIVNGDERLEPVGPFGLILRGLGVEEKVFKPTFRDYDELFLILKEVFQLFEDIKGETLLMITK